MYLKHNFSKQDYIELVADRVTGGVLLLSLIMILKKICLRFYKEKKNNKKFIDIQQTK